jgi:hypothetical protein
MNIQSGLNWQDVIFKCLGDLKIKYPRLADADIAKKIDMSSSSFNRIKNGRNKPRVSNLIKIVIGSGNQEILPQAVSLIDKSLAENIDEIMSVSLKEKDAILNNEEIETLLQEQDVFVTYLLASCDYGTTRDQIIDVLGKSGLNSIDKLISNELIKEENGRIVVLNDGILVRSFESIKSHLSTYARFYKTNHVGQKRNYVHSLSSGLNKKGIEKGQELHREFHEKMQALYRDENYKGEIPMFSVGFCDSFTSIESEKGRELQ